jgi:hypothetical protein
MILYAFGNIGSDAGYWVFRDGHWVHVGGWQIEAKVELSQALKILGETARLKTPGLADSVTKGLAEFVQKELGAHNIKDAGVVIFNAAH